MVKYEPSAVSFYTQPGPNCATTTCVKSDVGPGEPVLCMIIHVRCAMHVSELELSSFELH